MEVGKRLVQYSSEDPCFTIFDISDIHLGNTGCCKRRLQKDIDRVRLNPNALWFLGGDYADFVTPSDKRWDPEIVDPEMISVRDLGRIGGTITKHLLQYLEPIRAKCLGACYGNHEHKYMKSKEQIGIHEAVCEALSCPNLRYSAILVIYFERVDGLKNPVLITNPKPAQLEKKGQVKLRVLIHHGFSAANTAGGKMQALARLHSLTSNVHLAIMGHLHEKLSKVFTRLKYDEQKDKIEEDKCQTMLSGSYLRTYGADFTSYGEIRGYQPTSLGASAAKFYPKSMELEIVSGTEEVGERL